MFSTALQGEKHLSGNTSGNVFFIFFYFAQLNYVI